MKKVLDAFTLCLLFIIAFSANIYAQKSDQKLTAKEVKERAQVTAFVDSFMQEYYKTYDLTKVPATFFVNDYKKRNAKSLFADKFGDQISDDEKFREYFIMVDGASLLLALKLKVTNFDYGRIANDRIINDKGEKAEFEKFSKSVEVLFKKYPKASSFIDFEKIGSVDDYRTARRDYQMFLQEVRGFVLNNTPEQNRKFATAMIKFKAPLFRISNSFECAGKNCEGFSAKTKMYEYQAFPTAFLIVKDSGQFKIVKLLQPIGG